MSLRVASAASSLRDAESVQRMTSLIHTAAEAVSGPSPSLFLSIVAVEVDKGE
jgi:hypothetical protein